jgi:ArsR family transcriptional regulator
MNDSTELIDDHQWMDRREERQMARKSLDVLDADACCPSLLAAPMEPQAAASVARAFSALADPVRLQLVSLLAVAESGEVCVCDLTVPVGRSQPTVSHHLKVLAEAGIVASDKRGRWAWYRLVPERVAELRSALA